MKNADLISRSKEINSNKLLQQVFVLILSVLLLAGCGGAPAEPTATLTPIPTTGSITGIVLGDDYKPLANINDQEILVVALFCPSNDSAIECFHEINQEMDFDVLNDSICEANDTGSNCLLHFGQGAVPVEADGSYTITSVPPGQYGLVFLYYFPELDGYSVRGYSIERDVESVQAGNITEYDIVVDFHRN
jgi:hypothetical protein